MRRVTYEEAAQILDRHPTQGHPEIVLAIQLLRWCEEHREAIEAYVGDLPTGDEAQ